MKIGLHGGNCCGVKHIYSLGGYPEQDMAARGPLKVETSFGPTEGSWSGSASFDMMHGLVNKHPMKDFFNVKAPKETFEARFRRFVKFIQTKRPHGIIEVVINGVQKKWIPIFEDLGFKQVSEGKNSNTASTITVYHLVY